MKNAGDLIWIAIFLSTLRLAVHRPKERCRRASVVGTEMVKQCIDSKGAKRLAEPFDALETTCLLHSKDGVWHLRCTPSKFQNALSLRRQRSCVFRNFLSQQFLPKISVFIATVMCCEYPFKREHEYISH